jgi:hypothetical protein
VPQRRVARRQLADERTYHGSVQRQHVDDSLVGTSIVVIAFAVAMAYLEAAVVVYLRQAIGIEHDALFPLRLDEASGNLGLIEVGREVATLVMIAAVGWLAGTSWIERLAWAAVLFGAWDIAYYGWLWAFVGWPPSPATWDILFLVPVPWVGPVWAPIAVSAALIAFGLLAARRLRRGGEIVIGPWQRAGGLAGGILVVASFMLDAGHILSGGVPVTWAWPSYIAGMTLAALAAVTALWPGSRSRRIEDRSP